MKASELREKTPEELVETEAQLRRELFGFRMKNHTGQLADTSQLRKLRREIARVKGVLQERQSAASAEGEQS